MQYFRKCQNSCLEIFSAIPYTAKFYGYLAGKWRAILPTQISKMAGIACRRENTSLTDIIKCRHYYPTWHAWYINLPQQQLILVWLESFYCLHIKLGKKALLSYEVKLYPLEGNELPPCLRTISCQKRNVVLQWYFHAKIACISFHNCIVLSTVALGVITCSGYCQ